MNTEASSSLPPTPPSKEPELETTSPRVPSFIDKITLECMMNRHHYKHYFSNHPLYVENTSVEFEKKLKLYQVNLKESLLDLVDGQNIDNYSLDTRELFEKLVNKLVKQYENTEQIQTETFGRCDKEVLSDYEDGEGEEDQVEEEDDKYFKMRRMGVL